MHEFRAQAIIGYRVPYTLYRVPFWLRILLHLLEKNNTFTESAPLNGICLERGPSAGF